MLLYFVSTHNTPNSDQRFVCFLVENRFTKNLWFFFNYNMKACRIAQTVGRNMK